MNAKDAYGSRRKFAHCVVFLMMPLIFADAYANPEPRFFFDPPTVVNENTRNRAITSMDLALRREIIPMGGDGPFGATAVSISPDKTHMAFQVVQGDPNTNLHSNAWFVAPTDGAGRALRVSDAGEPQLRTTDSGIVRGEIVSLSRAKWSPDGRWIAYLLDRDGEVQLWRSRSDGSVQERLTKTDADVRDFYWTADGASLFIVVNKRARAELRAERRAASQRGHLIDLHSFRAMYSVVPTQSLETQTDERILDLASKEERRLTVHEQKVLDKLRAKGNPLSSITEMALDYFLTESNAEPFRTQYRYRKDVAKPVFLAGNRQRLAFTKIVEPEDRIAWPTGTLALASVRSPNNVRLCQASACTGIIKTIWPSSDGEEAFFLRQGDNFDSQAIYVWSVDNDDVSLIYQDNLNINNCAQLYAQLICLYSTPTQPELLVSLDLQTGSLRPLVDINPEFRSLSFTDVERLEWRWHLDDGWSDSTSGYLIEPRGYEVGKRYPLVILTYNATGFLDNSTGREYPAHVLADKGFAVLVFHRPYSLVLRPGEVHQDEYLDFRNVLTALETVIDLLDDRGLIDPARVALTGLSNGTAITEFALSRSSKYFAAAVVSSNTYESMGYFLIEGRLRRRFDKDYWNVDWALSKNAEEIETPILFNLPEVEVLPTMQSLVALHDNQKPFEAFVFPDEYHIKWQPAHRFNIYRRNVQWLRFWLQGKEDGDPVYRDQYARWRGMRDHQCDRLNGDDAPWYCRQ